MAKDETTRTGLGPEPAAQEPRDNGSGCESSFRVEDRRHWRLGGASAADEAPGPEPARPTTLDSFRQRAEEAERTLLEYIEAFKRHKDEQQQVRERLERDVARKVALRFG